MQIKDRALPLLNYWWSKQSNLINPMLLEPEMKP